MQKPWSWATTGYTFVGRSHEEIRATCAQAGLSGLEAVAELVGDGADAELEALAAEYRAAGLSFDTFHLPFSAGDDIASFYETIRLQAVDKMKHWIGRAAALGVRAAIQHPSTTRQGVDVEGLDRYLRQIGRSLEQLLPVCQALGITLAIENMLPAGGGRFCSRPEHFRQLASEFGHPNLGFCLDTGHALVAGGGHAGAAAFIPAMGDRLVAYHLADNAGDRDSHLAPGRGLVDFGPVFRAAASHGFSGNMCIETPPFAPGPEYSDAAWGDLVRGTEALADAALG